MKRSFAEFHMQKDAQERKREMEELEKKLQNIKDVDCTFCAEDLKQYFKDCRELSELTRTVQVMSRHDSLVMCVLLKLTWCLTLPVGKQLSILNKIFSQKHYFPDQLISRW